MIFFKAALIILEVQLSGHWFFSQILSFSFRLLSNFCHALVHLKTRWSPFCNILPMLDWCTTTEIQDNSSIVWFPVALAINFFTAIYIDVHVKKVRIWWFSLCSFKFLLNIFVEIFLLTPGHQLWINFATICYSLVIFFVLCLAGCWENFKVRGQNCVSAHKLFL